MTLVKMLLRAFGAAQSFRVAGLKLSLPFVFIFALIGSTAYSQILYQYTTSVTGTPGTVATNATGSNLSRVNGLTASVCTNGFPSTSLSAAGSWASTVPAVQFTISPNPAFQLNLTQLSASVWKSAASGFFRLSYSLDGTTWALATSSLQYSNGSGTCASNPVATVWNFTDFTATSTVYFRIYFYGSVTTQIQYVKNVTVNGTVVPLVLSGCTDATACNYCALCTIDNGTCTYPGCTDITYCNYDALAGCDDGSCSNMLGCTNAAACNFNPAAACDNGSCIVPGNACNDGNGATVSDIIQLNCSCAGVISPFNGLALEEVIISPAALAVINPQVDAQQVIPNPASARTWRAYVCFNQPNWELQGWQGGNGASEWYTNTTTKFFQAQIGGGEVATDVNAAFYPFFPELQYDSWFTINADNNSFGMNLIPAPSPTGNCWNLWENIAGNNFSSNCEPIFGLGLVNATSYPNTTGMPDAANRVLFAQLTTDGIISSNFNFQIRRMNLDGSVYAPTTLITLPNVFLDGTPGAAPDACAIVFLPVEMLSFQAFPQDEHVVLNWVTATEVNSDYFEVEKSNDLIHWEYVFDQKAAGNSFNTIYYANLDMNPWEGTSYYRIKSVDFDGQFEYAPPIVVEFYRDDEFMVFPNPSKGDRFVIGGKLESLESLNIRGIDGRIAHSFTFNNLSGFQKDVYGLNLPAGTYMVEFMTHRGIASIEKLIVQR
ncbi:MAG: T9SS type A sorting domain-containing protein [Flavobacteriales bacterium]|nr:T9SS type A sorting domain-containing protein [Flavobacteriales bacterium]